MAVVPPGKGCLTFLDYIGTHCDLIIKIGIWEDIRPEANL